MKKNILIPVLIGVLLCMAGLWYFLTRPKTYVADLTMESEAMSMVDYYVPYRISLTTTPAESALTLPQFNTTTPKFGYLHLGNSDDPVISIALDENPGSSLLYVDRNNNEDLTDDGDPAWDEENRAYRSKEVLIDVGYGTGANTLSVPYPVVLYRYKNRLPDAVIAYRNGLRKGAVMLADSSYKIALLDDDLDGLFDDRDAGTLIIDRNSDGVLDGSADSDELYPLNASFVVGPGAYRIKSVSQSGDRVVIVATDRHIEQGVRLQENVPSPAFYTIDIEGKPIALSDYAGQVVLVDFWATWCKPWQQDLTGLRRLYRKYQPRGFEIIGINLDYDLELMHGFIKEKDIRWRQIATGEGWQMPFVDLFNVRGLPKRFLLDRRGIVRYKDLTPQQLDSKIRELLDESETD